MVKKIEEERNLFFVGKKDKNNTIIYIIMSFTEKSENLIKGFVKEFENYCVKKSAISVPSVSDGGPSCFEVKY